MTPSQANKEEEREIENLTDKTQTQKPTSPLRCNSYLTICYATKNKYVQYTSQQCPPSHTDYNVINDTIH